MIRGSMGTSVTSKDNQNIEKHLVIPSKAVVCCTFTLGQMRRGKAFIKQVP